MSANKAERQWAAKHLAGLKRPAVETRARRAGIPHPQRYNLPELRAAVLTRLYGPE